MGGAGWGSSLTPIISTTQVFPPLVLYLGATGTWEETSPFPTLPLPSLEPGAGPLALWASLPHMGNQGREWLPFMMGKFRIPVAEGPSPGWQPQNFLGPRWEDLRGLQPPPDLTGRP